VAQPTKSGKTCTDRDALKFMMLCQAQRLNPFAGDAFLLGYDGQNGPQYSLITAHQAFLKRAETSDDYDGMESGIIIQESDSDEVKEIEGDFHMPDVKVLGGWARVHHKKRTHPTYRRIRMERFNKGRAQWNEDPAGMICKCAEADALRSTFPTLLGGLYIKGEVIDVGPAVETSKPLFQEKQIKAATATEAMPETDNPDGDLGPTASEITPEPAKPATNYLRAVTGLLKLSKITESELIEFLRATRNLEDSISTIQEMSIAAEPTLQWTEQNWKTVVKEITNLRDKK
jgi:phage recombination protein Bet